MIAEWGQRFEPEKDILPIFTSIYEAMKAKGIDFPAY